jgi:multidrug resistance protein MdtO
MDRNSEAQVPDTSRETLAQTLAEMAIILMNGAYPIKIVLPAAPHTSDNPLAAKILAEIEDALVRFTEPSTEASPVRETAEETTGFFESDAFTNPDHVHYALKTTAAAMFCYVLYSLLDWPAIHTCFITCYIVSQSTTAESVEKLTLRIVGCLIGAAAGIAAIVFLIPALTSIGALMAVVFFGAYAAAYVAAGSPRISYVGFQIAFAFFLCVIQGPSPDFDMTIARDRVIGILLGNLVVYVAFTNLWPISVGKRIDPAIASLLRKLGAMMTTIDLSARRALASQAQLALATIETDIGLAQYEPSNVRPPRTWIDARRDAVRDMGELVSPLLLSAAQDPSTSVCISGRLETLASAFAAATEPAAAHAKPRSEWSALPLFGIVDSILRRLERATAQHV